MQYVRQIPYHDVGVPSIVELGLDITGSIPLIRLNQSSYLCISYVTARLNLGLPENLHVT
jgi:hypothetical protein